MIKVSKHARTRAVERFGVQLTEAASWVRNRFAQARYIGTSYSAKGDLRHVYAYHRVEMLVSEDKTTVVTVYPQYKPAPSIREKVEALLRSELDKAESLVRWHDNRASRRRAALDFERAGLTLRMMQTRSQAVRMACQARINALDTAIADIDNKLRGVRAQRNAVVESQIVYAV